jgi:curved DNA-binding protein
VKDYYLILGVPRTASNDEIKRAYRKLAMQHHPDRGGDQVKFQDINEAYITLSDPGKKQAYDNPAPAFSQGGAGFPFTDFFEMFGMRPGGAPHQNFHHQRSPRMNLWITLEDVARGGPRIIAVQIGNNVSNVEIHIPPGINDGDTVRYSKIAPGGQDIIITYKVKPDAKWERQGKNIITDMPVSIWELITGSQISIVDLQGNTLLLTVPPKTQPGTMMRARGKGLPDATMPGNSIHGHGDLLLKLQAKFPESFSENILEAIRTERGL